MMSRPSEQESLWGHKIHLYYLYFIFAHFRVSCTRDCNFCVLGVSGEWDSPFFEYVHTVREAVASLGRVIDLLVFFGVAAVDLVVCLLKQRILLDLPI